MARPLEGRIALVTGGGRGIGRTLALGLAQAGAAVAVAARTADEVNRVACEIRETGQRALAITRDVAIPADARHIVDECMEWLGPPGVVVNAAAVQGPIGRFDSIDILAWDYSVHVNLMGVAMVTHAAIRHMMARRRGKVVNVSGGGSASPRPRFTAYASSKAAVVRFTETLAEELQEFNIQVNAVGPGATRTRMTKEVLEAGAIAGPRALSEALEIWRTGGTPADRQVALVNFLASDDSNHVTGRFIHVNDPWQELLGRGPLPDDLFTLRRIGPNPLSTR